MRKQLLLLVVALLPACATAPHSAPSLAGATTDPTRPSVPSLRMMSFNLRYNNAGDGPNAWPLRKAWVAQLIRFHDADAIGVQEALPDMLADLDTLLPEFARVGVGRTDGVAKGEFSAILYRRDRIEMLANSTFWLSPTPEVPGSRGWDAALERVATWGRFRDRATGCTYLHLNTHFDHKGERARQESARIIRQRLATLATAGSPVVVTGDLNTNPRSVAYGILTRDTIAEAFPQLVDAMQASREGHYGPGSSITGFRAIPPDGNRIDYVMTSPGIEVRKHAILTDSWDNRFPSDHLPVIAALAIRCR